MLYSSSVETILTDENQGIDDILASMDCLSNRIREQAGRAIRVSHAKSHGSAVGKLTVIDNLPEHPAQGLFAKAVCYPVIV